MGWLDVETGATLEKIDKFAYHGGKSGTHDNPRFPWVVVDAGRRSAIRGSFEAGEPAAASASASFPLLSNPLNHRTLSPICIWAV